MAKNKYILPGVGEQIESEDGTNSMYQSTPLLHDYSTRLFGAPPQLTRLNDMRLLSSTEDSEGAVGDYYLERVLRTAQVANFCVGRAIFTGGMSSLANVIRVCGQYAYALSKYDIYGQNGAAKTGGAAKAAQQMNSLQAYQNALNADDNFKTTFKFTTSGSSLGLDVDEGAGVYDISGIGADSFIKSIADSIDGGSGGGAASSSGNGKVTGTIMSALLTSFSVQQPFYTFSSDWSTYINNVKMMINTAVIMLGLQSACVRIGDYYYPIALNVKETKEDDCWANYRYITPTAQLGDVTAADGQKGDTQQYVSFMVNNPTGIQESYTNNVGPSLIYSNFINQGSQYGNEIAFITNSSVNKIDDSVINLMGKATNVAESILSSLSGGAGRFTAAILGSMSRSFTGDHTIYPQVFQSHTTQSSVTIPITLTASNGGAYAYLTEILVPMFFLMGMALPRLSKNNAAAYAYPPVVQCSIPGTWGTRLGMVTQLSINKNPNGDTRSINGWPTQVTISLTVTDLEHTLVTSPMNEVATFLNNNTMFDYIAQCAAVDKYRVNGAVRLVSKLTLASSAMNNFLQNLGDGIATDWHMLGNRITGNYLV
jgi:hypothetical protein